MKRLNIKYDNNYFEKVLERLFKQRVKNDELFAIKLYCSVTNTDWNNINSKGKYDCGFSFRYAAALIAIFREDGTDYTNWYCSGHDLTPPLYEGTIDKEIEIELKKQGWCATIIKE